MDGRHYHCTIEKTKSLTSAGKVKAFLFWETDRILLKDYLKKHYIIISVESFGRDHFLELMSVQAAGTT